MKHFLPYGKKNFQSSNWRCGLFGHAVDGAYNGSTHQLALFATVSNNGTTFYEAFLGNR